MLEKNVKIILGDIVENVDLSSVYKEFESKVLELWRLL